MSYDFDYCCEEHAKLEREQSSSEEFRVLCLARRICSMPSLDDRRRFLTRWEDRHPNREKWHELTTLIEHVWALKRERPGAFDV